MQSYKICIRLGFESPWLIKGLAESNDWIGKPRTHKR